MSDTITIAPGHGTVDTFDVIAVNGQSMGQRVTFQRPFEVSPKPKMADMWTWSIATTLVSATSGADQWYYWTPAWQREEARSVSELRSGQYMEFNDAESAIAWLLGPDE